MCVIREWELLHAHAHVCAQKSNIFHEKTLVFPYYCSGSAAHVCNAIVLWIECWMAMASDHHECASVCACTFFDVVMWPIKKLFSCIYGFVLWQTIQMKTNKNVVVNALKSCAQHKSISSTQSHTLFIRQWTFLRLIYSIKLTITFSCKKQIVAKNHRESHKFYEFIFL